MGRLDGPGPFGAGEPSLERLLGAARRGDQRARDDLYARLLPGLRRWASRRLPAHARGLIDTDDLTQEAVLRTFGRLDALDLDAGGLVAYLRTAVLNRIRDELRATARRPVDPGSLGSAADVAPSPLEQAIGAQAVERYERALQELPPRERGAVVMRLELGLDYQSIAAALEWDTANAARMAVSRAIERMAGSMSDGAREPAR